ncbi:hypothetical protein DQ04_00581190 [Trypanosoma grayi]|uniref:hypothetical protein n=1 Tax=Trypanosoma grayi TaxID=71804 RepID=UPI0004F4414E|nr:hypothetical protein DQ04_00581190 [Trypanosoma grayi]KEG14201.1 hypothetical protein DQ04_00581190 [Trypanosoma grayi]
MNRCDQSVERLKSVQLLRNELLCRSRESVEVRAFAVDRSVEELSVSFKKLKMLMNDESKVRAERDGALSLLCDEKLGGVKKSLSDHYSQQLARLSSVVRMVDPLLEKAFTDLSQSRLLHDTKNEVICKEGLQRLQETAEMIEEESVRREYAESNFLEEAGKEIIILSKKLDLLHSRRASSIEQCRAVIAVSLNRPLMSALNLSPKREMMKEELLIEIVHETELLVEALSHEHRTREGNLQEAMSKLHQF